MPSGHFGTPGEAFGDFGRFAARPFGGGGQAFEPSVRVLAGDGDGPLRCGFVGSCPMESARRRGVSDEHAAHVRRGCFGPCGGLFDAGEGSPCLQARDGLPSSSRLGFRKYPSMSSGLFGSPGEACGDFGRFAACPFCGGGQAFEPSVRVQTGDGDGPLRCGFVGSCPVQPGGGVSARGAGSEEVRDRRFAASCASRGGSDAREPLSRFYADDGFLATLRLAGCCPAVPAGGRCPSGQAVGDLGRVASGPLCGFAEALERRILIHAPHRYPPGYGGLGRPGPVVPRRRGFTSSGSPSLRCSCGEQDASAAAFCPRCGLNGAWELFSCLDAYHSLALAWRLRPSKAPMGSSGGALFP